MFCPKCGKKNPDDNKFCEHCGSDLPVKVPNLIGQLIDGKYRIDEKLGAGGMGDVYKANRLLIGDTVAIKVLHPHLASDPPSVERFRREAIAATKLRHRNIVALYDFGISGGDKFPYLLMEFAEGVTLREVIRQKGILSLDLARTVLTQVCEALEEAHRLGIVHRDIKPENIMAHQTASGWDIKVLDFGIAKLQNEVRSDLTQDGSVAGTPQYMSPEQCLGNPLDGRSDIYAIGIVLYEMLGGKVPFTAENPNVIALKHIQEPPASLLKYPHITAKIEQVVFRSLAKNPPMRQQTANELAREFNLAVSTGAGIESPTLRLGFDSETLSLNQITPQVLENTVRLSGITETVKTANQPTLLNNFGIGGNPQNSFGQPDTNKKSNPKSVFGPLGLGAAIVLVLGLASGLIFLNFFRADADKNNENNANGEVSSKKSPPPPAGMVYVPGGLFIMGGDKQNYGKKVFLSPPHEISVKPFFIDIYEVTCEDYKKFTVETGYQPPLSWKDGNFPPGTDKFPVTGVNWDAANEYAKWAGKRLPTEAEWEFAAKGTDKRLYSWGSEWKEGMANAGKINNGMVEVGKYKGVSPVGTYDMIGNAWEWTATGLQAYPNGTLPDLDTDKNIEIKIIRGGTWSNDKDIATTTRRGFWGARTETDYSNTGFRCVKDITASQ